MQSKKNWKANLEKKKLINEIRKEVKNNKVVCALSGGVDSSVVALIINESNRLKFKMYNG